MTPGPGLRKRTEYLRPGPGGMPLALLLSEGLGLAAMARVLVFINLVNARHARLKQRGNSCLANRASVLVILVLKYSYAVFGKAFYARQMSWLSSLHRWLVKITKNAPTQVGKFVVFRLSLKVFQLHQFFFERAYLLGELQGFLLAGERNIVGLQQLGVHLRKRPAIPFLTALDQ